MRTPPTIPTDRWRTLVATSHPVLTVISAWRDGSQLAEQVPVTEGTIGFDDTATIRRSLSISVPISVPGGRSWDPADDVPTRAPLAAYGQRLQVQHGMLLPDGSAELLNLGWYLITEWERDETRGVIKVSADDLSRLLEDDRFLQPVAPPTSARDAAVMAVGQVLPLDLTGAPADVTIPDDILWEDSRADALDELCEAWPARWWCDDQGTLRITPPYPPVDTPQISWTDGHQGTLVERGRAADRGTLANTAIVEGGTGDDTFRGVAQRTGEPDGADTAYGVVTVEDRNSAIGSAAAADRAAAALLAQQTAQSRAEDITVVPDPTVELGDQARVYTADGNAFLGRVVALDLPLTVDGPMRVTIAQLT